MCVLFSCISKLPSRTQFENSLILNSDGIGVAWVDRDKVHWEKGIEDIDTIYEVLKGKKFPYGIHFRSASSGGAIKELTHPFPLDQNSKTALKGSTKEGVLFQNGTWLGWENELRDVALHAHGVVDFTETEWSDARALAWLAGRFGVGYLSLLNFGTSRLLLMRPKQLLYWGEWLEGEGFYASNAQYKNSSNVLKGKPTTVSQQPKAETKSEVTFIPNTLASNVTSKEVQLGKWVGWL